MRSEIRFCARSHEYQDSVYGKNQRVHNYGKKMYKAGGGGTPGWRCTACGTVKRA